MARNGTKTGGRKKGSKNKRTLAGDAAKAGKLPLDYMLQVMRDESVDNLRRDDMARAAAPYLHARRASENREGQAMPSIIYVTPNLEDE